MKSKIKWKQEYTNTHIEFCVRIGQFLNALHSKYAFVLDAFNFAVRPKIIIFVRKILSVREKHTHDHANNL